MDQADLSSSSVLETLLKTNRPPTDQERSIIQEYMSPTIAKLKAVEVEIVNATVHIQALTLQSEMEETFKKVFEETFRKAFEEAEIKLQRLRSEKAAILKISADHRGVLSTFRILPEDVLREICVACVEADIPKLSYRSTPLPYVLAQISSEMRHIVLTTPYLWASINVRIPTFYSSNKRRDTQIYSVLASRANEWLERAGGLALTVFMEDPNYATIEDTESDPSHELFNTFLKYSTRWRRIQVESNCRDALSAPITRIASLTAVDVPLLESISLLFEFGASVFCNSTLLAIPTLKRLTLNTRWDNDPDFTVVSDFPVNWAILTSITLYGEDYYPNPIDEIAWIFQQPNCLVFCDIVVGPSSGNLTPRKINLPLLEIFRFTEKTFEPTSSGAPISILDLIDAPNLTVLNIRAAFLKNSLLNFFKRSPGIQDLSLSHLDTEESLTDITELLHHCPSLSILSLQPPWKVDTVYRHLVNADRFLRAFVEDGGVGVTCPRLQTLDFAGKIMFSLQTLRQFLEVKQRGSATLNNALAPWKSVLIDLTSINKVKLYRQMLDLLSEKQAAGLDVRPYYKDEAFLPDKYLYRWTYTS